jgi:hypothetical protein
VYKDEEGVAHTVKGSVSAIRRSLKEGLLGDASNIRASRTKTGPFENLRSYPEFRDLVVEPAPMTVPRAVNTPVGPPLDTPSARTPSPTEPRATPLPAPAAAPTADDDDMMPHIDLAPGPAASTGPSVEWLKWLLLLLIAVATAVIAYFLLPTK